MTKARDDKRRNNRRAFALYRDDDYSDEGPTPVGRTFLGEADGCWNEYGWEPWSEWRQHLGGGYSETHVPDSHAVDDRLGPVLATGRR